MPITLKADASSLWSGVRNLFSDSTSTAFTDIQIADVSTCRCFLAAAAAPSTTIQEVAFIESECKEVPPQSSRGLLELVLGQEVTLAEHDDFFRLFSLAQKLQWRSCMDLCKEVISKSKNENLPIVLKLTPEHGVRILSSIHAHSVQLPGDAIIKIRRVEDLCSTEGSPSNSKGSAAASDAKVVETRAPIPSIQVHRTILAASCEYVRGLWSGAFLESSTRSEVLELQLDEVDLKSFKALLTIVYGGSAELPSIDDVVELFRFADRWQCNAVKSQALAQILSNLSQAKAMSILDSESPLPSELLRACAQKYLEYSVLPSVSLGAALRLLEGAAELQAQERLLKMAGERVLAELGECPKGFAWAVKCMNNASTIAAVGSFKDVVNTAFVWSAKKVCQFQNQEAWLQIQPEAMISLLLEISHQGSMDSLVARHMLQWTHEWSSNELAEYIPLLMRVVDSALNQKQKDFQLFFEKVLQEIATGENAPAIVSSMLNAVVATNDSYGSEPQVVEDTFGQTSKRRRVAKLLNGRSLVTELHREALKQWLSKDERFAQFCHSVSWNKLTPAALLEAISLAPLESKTDTAIHSWVRCACVNDIFDAALLTNRGPVSAAVKALQDAARDRFSALAEGRHQEDVAKAVEADRLVSKAAAATEMSRMKKQYNDRIVVLEGALRGAQAHIEKAVKDALVCETIDASIA